MIKKIISIALSCTMLFSTISCNKKQDIKDEKFNMSKIENYFIAEKMDSGTKMESVDYSVCNNGKIYTLGSGIESSYTGELLFLKNKEDEKFTKVKIPSEITNGLSAKYVNDKIYMINSLYDSEEISTTFYELSKEGEILNKIDENSENLYFNNYAIDENDNIFILYKEDSLIPKSFLKKYDKDRKEVKSISLDEVLSNDSFSQSKDYGNIFVNSNGDIYIVENDYSNQNAFTTKIHILNSDFTFKSTITDITIPGISQIFKSKKNSIFAATVQYTTESNYSMLIDEIDLDTNQIVGNYEIEGILNIFEGDENFDCYYYKENILYGYNFDTQKQVITNMTFEDAEPFYVKVNNEEIFYTAYESFNQLPERYISIVNENGIEEALFTVESGPFHFNEIEVNDDNTISYLMDGHLYTYDTSGKLVSKIDLSKYAIQNIPGKLKKDNSGNIVIANGGMLSVLDSKGELLFQITGNFINHLFKMKNGDMIVTYFEGDKYQLGRINLETKEIEKDFKIEGFNPKYEDNIYDGNDQYSFIIVNSLCILGYDEEKKECVEVLNFIDSDIEGFVMSAYLIDDNTIFANLSNGNSPFGVDFRHILKRADEETLKKVQSKEVLTMSGINVSWLIDKVSDYNKKNDKYKIRVVDYSHYNSFENENAGNEELNNDLLKGKIPDILLINEFLNIDTYVNKNILTDLNEFFKMDKEIKREDFLENILNIYQRDGKLYQIPHDFFIKTMIGKTADVGEEKGWTFEEFLKFSKDKKDLIPDITKKDLVRMFLSLNMDKYVDYKKGKCDFQNDEFIKLIEFVKEYGITQDESISNYEDDRYNYPLFFEDIGGYDRLYQIEKGYVDEQITCKGIPTSNGIGSVIQSNINFSITEKSKYKEQAWEFVKTFLTDESQDFDSIMGAFPIKISALEKLEERYKNPKKFDFIFPYVNINNSEKQIGYVDDAGIEKVNDLIKSINTSVKFDVKIEMIINEELEAFYAGDKTAEEVAKLIQNRANTYINEIK